MPKHSAFLLKSLDFTAFPSADAFLSQISRHRNVLGRFFSPLHDNTPNEQVVKLKALEVMQKVAGGKATKIIIPSGMQGLAGLAAGVRAVWDEGETDS